MRWRFYSIIAIIVIIIFIIIFNPFRLEKLKSNITGKATSSNLAVTVNVDALPTLIIDKPRNETYYTNESLKLKIITNADNYWYNLNNGINNTLNSKEVYITAPSGSHTIYVFANNSAGTKKENVTFAVNYGVYNFSYSDYSGIGNTTNFHEYSLQELQNLSNIIVEDGSFGKIMFNEIINLTDDYNPEDDKTDIDSYIKFYLDRIELNSTALPNFNKSATLELYDLTLSNPRITKDGEVCSETICSQNSYSGGTLSFNVTHFTTYSVEETPIQSEISTQGDNGNKNVTKREDSPSGELLSLNKEKISSSIKQDESAEEHLTIKNNGASAINIKISSTSSLASPSESQFTLKSGEEKTITLIISAHESIEPGLYTGELIIEGKITKKRIPLVIEVESKAPLFDVLVEIPQKYKTLAPGEEISVNIKLFEIERVGKADVELEYSIRDAENNIIAYKKDTVSVNIQSDLIKSLVIPENIEKGNYIFYVNVKYDGKTASAAESFTVETEFLPYLDTQKYLYILSLIILIVILITAYEIRKIKKHLKLDKIDEKTLAYKGLIKTKPEAVFARAFKKQRGK